MTICACEGSLSRYGRRKISVLDVTQQGVGRKQIDVARFRCTACKQISRDGPPVMGNQVRTALALEAIRDGLRPVARRTGCDDRTIKAVLTQWISDNATQPEGAHLTLGFSRPPNSNQSVILIYDPENEILVDVVYDVSLLHAWLRHYAPGLQLAIVGMDPQLTMTIRQACPHTHLAIAPSTAQAAMIAAAQATVRDIARKRTGNFREREPLVDKLDNTLDGDELDELKCWSPAAKAVRRSLLHALAALQGKAPINEALDSVLRTLQQSVPMSGLTRLVATWKDSFIVGVNNRWLEPAHRRVKAILDDIARWKPQATAEMIKGVLLFAHPFSHQPELSMDYKPFAHVPSQSGIWSLDTAQDNIRLCWQP